MIDLTPEQQRAYDRFIRARNKVNIGQYGKRIKGQHIPQSTVLCTVDQPNMNHPMYLENDDWIEYLQASAGWWQIEPEFRKKERMSMIRGDYGDSDTWRDKQTKLKEI